LQICTLPLSNVPQAVSWPNTLIRSRKVTHSVVLW
jgi:hypothetical protein